MTVLAVSKVLLDADGRITAVMWGRVSKKTNDWAEPQREAPVSAVVEAIRAGEHVFALFPATHGHVRERRFMVVDYDGAWESIALDGPPAHEREVHDMDRLLP
jgi:hypothetical protein